MKSWPFCVVVCSAFLYSTSLVCSLTRDRQEYQYMDQLALRARTDKSSAFHNYTEIYSQYFAELKDQPITFLEIGIQRGYSVKLWEDYFPNANLHFIDISADLLEYRSKRSPYYFLDQGNKAALQALADEIGKFDVVLDDGGHWMHQQIASFQALFPYVKSGGLYIVEDLHTSYWWFYGGHGSPENPRKGPGTAVEFLKDLVDDLNFTGARSECADHNKFSPGLGSLTEYQKDIYSIHFYGSVCIIRKR